MAAAAALLPPAAALPVPAAPAPWVRAREVSPLALALASFGHDFPEPGSSEAVWASFEHAAFKVPALIAVLGCSIAVTLPTVLCCLAPSRTAKGSPPWGGFVSAGCLTATCLVVGLVSLIRLGGRSLVAAGQELRETTVDLWKAKRYAMALNASGVAVLRDLALMYEACPQDAQDYLGNSVSGIESSVRSYNEVAVRLAGTILSLPRKLVVAQKAVLSLGTFYSWHMALPSLLLVALCCGIIAAIVGVQEWAGPRVARRCERCQMPLVSLVLVAPAVVLLSMAASFELSVGVELAAFCRDADGVTLRYAGREFGAGSQGFNLTTYYVTGKGSNEALTTLSMAGSDISSCIDWMQKYRPIIERTCPEWRPWNVTVNLQAVLVSLNETRHLLAPASVYGHYSAVVGDFACDSALTGIALVVACQVLLALVLLPTFACCAGWLLKGLSAEREMGHRFDLLPQDEETDSWRG